MLLCAQEGHAQRPRGREQRMAGVNRRRHGNYGASPARAYGTWIALRHSDHIAARAGLSARQLEYALDAVPAWVIVQSTNKA